MVEHVDIPDGEIHEPKGISTATSSQIYVSDGAGSGSFQIHSPMGGWRYSDIATGTTYTTPTVYEVMNVVGVTSHLKHFTNNSLGRLTYTGTEDRHVHMVCDFSFKHSTGSGNDCFFSWYKNGVAQSAEMVVTADSGNYQHAALHYDETLSTNDYLELYLKTSSGNIIVHSAYMFCVGMPM